MRKNGAKPDFGASAKTIGPFLTAIFPPEPNWAGITAFSAAIPAEAPAKQHRPASAGRNTAAPPMDGLGLPLARAHQASPAQRSLAPFPAPPSCSLTPALPSLRFPRAPPSQPACSTLTGLPPGTGPPPPCADLPARASAVTRLAPDCRAPPSFPLPRLLRLARPQAGLRRHASGKRSVSPCSSTRIADSGMPRFRRSASSRSSASRAVSSASRNVP